MNNAVSRDLTKSNDLFIGRVWDTIKDVLQCNELYSVELENTRLTNLLDLRCGIDFVAENDFGGAVTIAARVQESINYETFTIRYKRFSGSTTEYEKRRNSIKNGWLYPMLTIQSYLVDDTITTAIVKTDELYNWLGALPPDELRNMLRSTNNASFLVVPWEQLRANNINLIIEVK